MRTTVKFNKMLMLILLFTLGISVSWAATITVQLRDSDGNTLPDGNTARLTYYQGGWVDIASNDGNGNFEVDISLLPKTVKMIYNASGENRILTGAEISPVVFNTVTFTAVVENANGDVLTIPQPQFNHRVTSWAGLTDAGTWIELLPGSHIISMKFHTGQRGRTVNIVDDNHREVFTTTTITPKLVDCIGNTIDVTGTPWRLTHGCVGPCTGCLLNQPTELLSEAQVAFKLWYGNECVEVIGNYPPLEPDDPNYDPYFVPSQPTDVIFYAPPILETFVWEDINEDGYQANEESLGISGVTVELVKPNGTLLMSTTTNSSGLALFFDYPVDQPIKIHCQPMNGYSFTKSKGSKTDQNNSDVDKNGSSPAFQAGSCGEFLSYIDAGMVINTSNKADFAAMNSNVLYPNPVRNAMSYLYDLDKDSPIHLSIYNTAGAEVMLVEDGIRTSGPNVSEWDVSSLKPGMYIFRALLGDEVITERFVKTQ